MVIYNNAMSTLEPPDIEENLNSIDIDMPGAETDTDDDDGVQDAYNGYEPLPMGPVDYQPNMDNEDYYDEEYNRPTQPNDDSSNNGVPNIIPVETELVGEVWNQPSTSSDIQMDSDKINEVKKAMLNFTLPAGNIPEWAKHIPEDQWKDNLLHKISNKKP